MSKLTQYKETECKCETCQAMCRRPCWGTPEDIQKIIDAGHGDKLMLDYWCPDESHAENIYCLCPALKGYEGQRAPFFPISDDGCTFLKDGLCTLHDKGLKPSEGRLSSCKVDHEDHLHLNVALSWKTEEAKELIESWSKSFSIDFP